jgi:hypothetical protein
MQATGFSKGIFGPSSRSTGAASSRDGAAVRRVKAKKMHFIVVAWRENGEMRSYQ